MPWRNPKTRHLRGRERRAVETPEEAQSLRQVDAAKHRRSRASETSEEVQVNRESNSVSQIRSRVSQTIDEAQGGEM